MKVAILYICTGNYVKFFDAFYQSCQQYFLKDAEKTYFVFTDKLDISNAPNVIITEKKCAGFPADSLFRFDMFLSKKETLKSFDYIYFFNSNALFVEPIGLEFLPDETGLVGAEWPGSRKPFKHPMFYPYETRQESLARIHKSDGYGKFIYFMGGVNGGKSDAYLTMCEELAQNIQKDYEHGIIACFHDESHINKYFRTHKCKILTREYCWPEEWPHNEFSPKLIFRHKVKLGIEFDHGRDHSIKGKILKAFSVIIKAIKWNFS
jgi:hypothetical protein